MQATKLVKLPNPLLKAIDVDGFIVGVVIQPFAKDADGNPSSELATAWYSFDPEHKYVAGSFYITRFLHDHECKPDPKQPNPFADLQLQIALTAFATNAHVTGSWAPHHGNRQVIGELAVER